MWPFRKRLVEKRAGYYVRAQLDAAIANATTGTTNNAHAVAALEAAVGVWSRAFAAAAVRGTSDLVAAALTPAVLGEIGRALIRRGESCWEISVDRGMLRLVPAGDWDVLTGGPDPDTWRYRISTYGPGRTVSKNLPSSAVVHCMFAFSATRPWAGIPPLGFASDTGKLAGGIESGLSGEMNGPSGHVIPTPDDLGADDEEGVDPLERLKTRLSGLRGGAMLVETTQSGFGQGREAAPAADWKQQRVGADPEAGTISLRTEVAQSVLAACGVSQDLLYDSEGSGRLAAWRQFMSGSLEPVLRGVEVELQAKLDSPGLRLDVSSLAGATDLQIKSRAFKGFRDAELPVDEALRLALLRT